MSLSLQEIKNLIREKLKFQPSVSTADFGYTEFYVLLSRLNQLERHFNEELWEHYPDGDVSVDYLKDMWDGRVESFPEVICLPRDRWGRKPINELIVKAEDYEPEVKTVEVGVI